MLLKNDVKTAIEAEIKYLTDNPKRKNQLLDDPVPLTLQINSIKVPKCHPKIARIPLPHSALQPDAEICLIVPDVKGVPNKDHDQHVAHYETLLRSKNVTRITKIMTFHELRTEYDTFELKRRLVELYDVFLVDGRISGKVVRLCGKLFYKKRKVPVPVKMQSSQLKKHIDEALLKTPLFIHGHGDSFVVHFGHTEMKSRKMRDNVNAIVEYLDREFPGGFENVRSLNVSAHNGLSIPVYVSLKNSTGVSNVPVAVKTKPKMSKIVEGELSTSLGSTVIVKPSGQVVVKRMLKTQKSTQKKQKSLLKTK